METEFDLRGEEGRKEGSSSRNFANYNFSLNFNAPSFLPPPFSPLRLWLLLRCLSKQLLWEAAHKVRVWSWKEEATEWTR
jgi:hypothetical protein